MSVASRPVSTGKTRTCPHCKATILESLSICPGCMHHLRFDSEAAKRQVAAAPALRVEGIIRHPPNEQPLEYFVIIAIRNDKGEEVTRQVVNVGALQAAEKRTFSMSVEVLPISAPVPPQKQNTPTGAFKAPAPSTPQSPPAPPPPSTSSTVAPASQAAGSRPLSPPAAPAAPGSPNAPKGPPLPGSARSQSSSTSAKPAQTSPHQPANPTSAEKSQSGYVLKPPSPGGPKRH